MNAKGAPPDELTIKKELVLESCLHAPLFRQHINTAYVSLV